MEKYKSFLETTMNTRDLGGYETETGGYTNCNVFIRSDEVLRPSQQDIDYLLSRQITTILDLREDMAVKKAPSPFACIGPLSFSYFHIPIEEGSQIPTSVSAVPDSYMEIAKAPNMNHVFSRLACAPYGALFHCSAGKDRTGVVSAVLLLLAGVRDEDIVENYRLTEFYSQRRFAWAKKNLPNLDINIIIPKKTYMIRFLHLFQEQYGDVQTYLKSVGISNEKIERLKSKLI